MEEDRPENEWRNGWQTVAAGLVGMTLMGLHTGSLGVMMKPLNELFGWSRSEISAGLTILTTLQLLIIPVAGLLIPRIGIRRIAIAGAIIYALGLLTLSFSDGNIWIWYLGWVLLSIAMGGVGPLGWTTAITRGFDKHRGVALALALSGIGIATFASPLISAFSLEYWGWRAPFIALSLFCSVILLPLMWWFMRQSPHFGPDEAERAVAHPVNTRAKLKILADLRVWQLALASFLMAACAGMIIVHLQAMMSDAGLSATKAAAYFTIIGPMLIIGRLVSGLLLDRFATRFVAALLFSLPAICCALLLGYNGSAFLGVLICLIFGLGYGAENDVLAYISGRFFPMRDYPLVYGVVYSMFALGYGVSATVSGLMFDTFGNYDIILSILIGCVLLGLLLILTLSSKDRRTGPALTELAVTE